MAAESNEPQAQEAQKILERAKKAQDPLAGGKSLAELAELPIDPEQTLLGDRFLCRKGTMLLVGRTGTGKSSASAQQDALFACGREAFGIRPAHPLNILTIQAEDDNGDLTEMAGGVIRGLDLTEEETEAIRERTLYLRWHETGQKFIDKLRRACTAAKSSGRPFDIVRINPLHAFAEGNLVDPETIGRFCRSGLNAIADDFDCGIIVVHHTPKINYTARKKMSGVEWIYAATGCADLANWARCSMIIADENYSAGVFRFIASKRRERIGWKDAQGNFVFERLFCHARDGGGIFWRPATEEESAGSAGDSQPAKKPGVLESIAAMDEATLRARAMNIVNKKPLAATDFQMGVMREFDTNPKYARTIAKLLTEGENKPVKVAKIGKVHWHGTAEQIAELKAPRLGGMAK